VLAVVSLLLPLVLSLLLLPQPAATTAIAMTPASMMISRLLKLVSPSKYLDWCG
jgi:hypothetical protein